MEQRRGNRGIVSTTAQAKNNNNNYYSPILNNDNFYHSHNNSHEHYRSESSESSPNHHPPPTHLQDQKSNTVSVETRNESFYKRILIIDDDPDVTFTFKSGLERYYHDNDNDSYNKTRFEVYAYNNPLVALSEFKPNFYDLLLTDINMPDMNGFHLCQKILELDDNVRVCFISAGEVNIEALREIHPKISLGCFIKKPVSIEYLVKRLSAELE
jgi:CheY-like chemotaxis protein